MQTIEEQAHSAKRKRPRNWWKAAFFVALIGFEITRELLVITSDERVQSNASFQLFHGSSLVVAEGTWERMDGGGPLTTTATRIECWKEDAQCIEAYSHASDMFLYPPTIDRFDAKFGPEAVTYENDIPDCATYSVRMDFKLNKVMAVRVRKENPKNSGCANLEPRIETQLADGYKSKNPTTGHFVPFFSLFYSLIN